MNLLADSLDGMSMSNLLTLNNLGRICGSSHSNEMVVLDRVKRKNSVRRMSIIEDGEIAEVLYLIPKQSMMEQLPFLNPNDYILCEKMIGAPADMSAVQLVPLLTLIRCSELSPTDVQIPTVMKEKVLQDQDECHPSAPAGKRLIQCLRCGEPCKGEVLRVQTSHFHIKCFTCKVCGCDLAQSGFFMKNGEYLCPLDFQRLHGTPCNNCREFVEGEVVTVLGKTYHPACFVCTICKQPFPAGDCVTFSGKDCLCQRCIRPVSPTAKDINSSNSCNGCGREIKNGQALLALGSQWHLGCFKCRACRRMLNGEYISKDGVPYCERDYQIQFGVQCEACQKFITGKVLEPTRSSSESSSSRPGSCTPGSPGRMICAKVDNEIIHYRDLAAIPRVKAIYDIEHPDMISYKTENDNSSALDNKGNRQDRQSSAESPGNVSETTEESFEMRKCIPNSTSHGSFGVHALYSRYSYTPSLPRSPQHFHRPDQGFNMYRRPPIYKQQDHPNSSTSQISSLPGYGRHGLNPVRAI
ncbi:hypothetical protein PAMA_012573 [Pampus argenteus]